MRKGFGFHDRHSPFRYNPETLFLGGTVPGALYDPSDVSTLFQDYQGTTPVTASGQPVGLILDKSQGATLGPELVVNGDFSSSANWNVGAGSSISGGKLNLTAGLQYNGANQSIAAFVTGRTYRVVFTVSNYTGGTFALQPGGGAGTIKFAANGTYTAYLVANAAINKNLTFYLDSASNPASTCSIDDVSCKLMPGNHAQQSSGTSRPVYTVDGSLSYLAFDGSNDSLFTQSIDFTGTDKMTVFAGVRKLSDAAQGVVAELSATIASNNGTFLLSAPNSAAANYNWSSKGTTQVNNTVTTYTAPNTAVLTGQADIAAPSNIIRVNGAQAGSVATTQGTGNYGNYPLYIGRRNNASLPFNGRLYGLIVLGAAASDWQVYVTEQWMAGKTGLQF